MTFMDRLSHAIGTLGTGIWKQISGWRLRQPILFELVAGTSLLATSYADENGQGQPSWERCKRELEAKGAALDWAAFCPVPVPDAENFFKAPKMAEWFGSGTNSELVNKLSLVGLARHAECAKSNLLADVKVITPDVRVTDGEADLVLTYNGSSLTLSAVDGGSPDNGAGARILELLESALAQGGNQMPIRSLLGSQGLTLTAQPLQPAKPLRIVVRTDDRLTVGEIMQFLPKDALLPTPRGIGSFRVESGGANRFRVFLGLPAYYTAASYLASTDQLTPEFSLVRAALARPGAQRSTECQEPINPDIPDFLAERVLTQTFAQRAQCHLLLHQPEQALEDLTLIHDLCRVVSRRPVTLVAALINVAVRGVYVSTVADGLHLQAWQEPQLSAIQQQLREVNLLPPMIEAFQWERFTALQTLERTATAEPREGVYESMTLVATLDQGFLDAADASRRMVRADATDRADQRAQIALSAPSPAARLAAPVFGNFTRSWQMIALNQTAVNEAFVACALERHRLALGHYPKLLESLAPRFATEIPRDPIGDLPLHYQPRENGRFLLYSVGWNGLDEGGQVCPPSHLRAAIQDGDWVWDSLPL